MRWKRILTMLLAVALCINSLPAKALSDTITKVIKQVEYNKARRLTLLPENNVNNGLQYTQIADLLQTEGASNYSDLAESARLAVLDYLSAGEEELSYWEAEGLNLQEAITCVFVMHEAGLSVEQVKRAQAGYENLEDVVPATISLTNFAHEVVMTRAQYEDLLNNILDGKELSEAIDVSGYTFEPLAAGDDGEGSPVKPVIDRALVAPYFSSSSQQESMSMNTGALTLTYPVAQLPGRNGLDVALSIRYDSSDAALYEPGYRASSRVSTKYYFLENYIGMRRKVLDGQIQNVIRWESIDTCILREFSYAQDAQSAFSAYAAGTITVISSEPGGTETSYQTISGYMPFPERSRSCTFTANGTPIGTFSEWSGSTPPGSCSYNDGTYSGTLARSGTYYRPSERVNHSDGTYTITEYAQAVYGGTVRATMPYIYEYYWVTEPIKYPGETGYVFQVSTEYERYYIDLKSPTYPEKTGDLGAGWSWNLPGYNAGSKILHTPDGISYELNSNLTFKDYTLSNMQFDADTGFTSTANVQSTWKLRLDDGTVYWFGAQGQCIGVADRFINRISYEYISGSNGYRLSKVVDTSNRQIVITYSEGAITITMPDGSATVLTQGNYGGRKTLLSIKNAGNQTTGFAYSFDNAGVTLSSLGSTNNTNANLTSVTHPTGAQTVYTYTSTREGMGSGNSYTAFKLQSRKDMLAGSEFLARTYAYAGTFTGYPTYGSIKDAPATYTYTSSVTNGDGVVTVYTFNNKGLATKQESSHSGVLLSSRTTDYNADKLPIRVSDRAYNEQGAYNESISMAQYDNKGHTIASWDAQANGDLSNTEHKVVNTYDDTYGLLLTSTYKTNRSTVIEQRHTLSVDKKAIEKIEVLENGTVKSIAEFSYDASGSVISQKQYRDDGVSFSETIYAYNASGHQTARYVTNITNAAGQPVTTAGFASGCVGERYEYDSMGRVIQSWDNRGVETSYSYDSLGMLTQLTNADGSSVQYARDYVMNQLTVTKENGAATRYEYNSLGYETLVWDVTGNCQISNKTYDSEMRVKTEQMANGTAIISYEYDVQGRIAAKTANDGQALLSEEHYVYDVGNAIGRKVTQTVSGGSNSPDQVNVSYTDNMGRAIRTGRIYNGADLTTTYAYDYVSRKISEKSARAYAEGWNVDYTSAWVYTWDGQVTRQYNAEGQYTQLVYENTVTSGKTVKTYDYAGLAATTPYCTTAYYDDLGRLIREDKPVEQVGGVIQYAKTEYYYDRNGAAGLLEQTRHLVSAPGEPEIWSVANNQYNARGFLMETALLSGSVPHDQVTYTYDLLGNMLSMTDAKGQVTTYTYDHRGNMTTRTDALGQVETCEYNDFGLLTGKTDRNGVYHSWSYDALGRELSYIAGEQYRTSQYSLSGQLLRQENETSVISYGYDALGHRVSEVEVSLDGTVEQLFTYNVADLRTGYTLTASNQTHQTAYQYDRLDRLTRVIGPNQTAVYTYDLNGNRARLTVGEVMTTYTYNFANWVTALHNETTRGVQSSFSYAYLLDGNQSRKTDHVKQETVNYSYDQSGRLAEESWTTGVENTGSIQYTYDEAGNRQTMTDTRPDTASVTSYTCDANNRLLSAVTELPGDITRSELYTYDPNGNQLSRRTEALSPANGTEQPSHDFGGSYELCSYNEIGQLVKVQTGETGLSAVYTYNPSGLRHSKAAGIETRIHVWDGANIAAEVSNGAVTWYVRGVGLLWSETPDGKVRTYAYNAHGDVVQLMGEKTIYVSDPPVDPGDPPPQGQFSQPIHGGALEARKENAVPLHPIVIVGVLKEYIYDAFGNEQDPDPNDANPFRYCGEYWDFETGTYYLRARYYDPATSRMLSPDTHWGPGNSIYGDDPLQLNGYTYMPDIYAIRQSSNLYVYCGNNPLMFVDPTGEFWHIIIGAAGGAVIGFVGSVATQYIETGDVNWRSARASAAAGAVTGGMAAATGGLSLTLNGTLVAGALIGGAGYGTYNLVNGNQPTVQGYVTSMLTGALLSGVSYKVVNGTTSVKVSGANSNINLSHRPTVSNQKLSNIIDNLYKGQSNPNKIGDGTTMAAIRNEIKTGLATGGTFHSQKGQESINGLNKLINSGTLSSSDASIAKALVQDLLNALIGK